MPENYFESRVKDLARRAGLGIDELDSSMARLRFDVGSRRGERLTVRIRPCDDTWEFSCLSIVTLFDETDRKVLWPLLLEMLERNANMQRGFWCLAQTSDKRPQNRQLVCQHSFPEGLLTPEEFGRICLSLVKEVGDLMEAMFGDLGASRPR